MNTRLKRIKKDVLDIEYQLLKLDQSARRLRRRWVKYWNGEGPKPKETVHQRLSRGSISLFDHQELLEFVKEILNEYELPAYEPSEFYEWEIVPIMPPLLAKRAYRGVCDYSLKLIGCSFSTGKKYLFTKILFHELVHLLDSQWKRRQLVKKNRPIPAETRANLVSNEMAYRLGWAKWFKLHPKQYKEQVRQIEQERKRKKSKK